MILPHHCRCNHVSRCGIYNHPSKQVQAALNNLMDVMAEYDDESGSCSILSFETQHAEGVFTSVTENVRNVC
jgi:predicted RNA-binding protein with PIN domain